MTKRTQVQLVAGREGPAYRAPDLDHWARCGIGLSRDYATAAAAFDYHVGSLPLDQRPEYLVRHRIYRLALHGAAIREQLGVEREKVDWLKGLKDKHGQATAAAMAGELLAERLMRLRGQVPDTLYSWDQDFMVGRVSLNAAGFSCLPQYLRDGFMGWEDARAPGHAALSNHETPSQLTHTEYLETIRHLNRCTDCAREFLTHRRFDAFAAQHAGLPDTCTTIRSAVRYGREARLG